MVISAAKEPSFAEEWGPVAASIFAALAASASWAAVAQARREWRRSQQPHLHAQATHAKADDRIDLSIANSGPGIARGVGFALVMGDSYVSGYPRTPLPGFLTAGDKTLIRTDLPTDAGPDAKGVASCEDSLGNLHGWNLKGEHKLWRRKTRILQRTRHWELSGEDILCEFYPELDLEQLRSVRGTVPKSAVEPQD